MLGELNNEQIDHVLQSQYIGRLGCTAGNEMYVMPVTYAYDGEYIYSNSKVGTKVEIMRKNPTVCFQVDVIDNMANWRSVIIWGDYEEIESESERKRALNILATKLEPMTTSETLEPRRQTMSPLIVEKELRTVAYRIHVRSKTGRYEKT